MRSADFSASQAVFSFVIANDSRLEACFSEWRSAWSSSIFTFVVEEQFVEEVKVGVVGVGMAIFRLELELELADSASNFAFFAASKS